MAINIWPYLNDHPEIKLTKRLVLLQLASIATPDGQARIAYSAIQKRIAGALSTSKRNVAALVKEFKVLDKQVTRIGPRRHAINRYLFRIPFTQYPKHFHGSKKRNVNDFKAKMLRGGTKPQDTDLHCAATTTPEHPRGLTERERQANLTAVRTLLQALTGQMRLI